MTSLGATDFPRGVNRWLVLFELYILEGIPSVESQFKLLRVVGGSRMVDVWLPVKGDSKSHGARPVHQITSMI